MSDVTSSYLYLPCWVFGMQYLMSVYWGEELTMSRSVSLWVVQLSVVTVGVSRMIREKL